METCTACEEDCEKTYVCGICGEEKNLCATMVGGFERPTGICTRCFHRAMFVDREVKERDRCARREHDIGALFWGLRS
jgi:hypothetical protein